MVLKLLLQVEHKLFSAIKWPADKVDKLADKLLDSVDATVGNKVVADDKFADCKLAIEDTLADKLPDTAVKTAAGEGNAAKTADTLAGVDESDKTEAEETAIGADCSILFNDDTFIVVSTLAKGMDFSTFLASTMFNTTC